MAEGGHHLKKAANTRAPNLQMSCNDLTGIQFPVFLLLILPLFINSRCFFFKYDHNLQATVSVLYSSYKIRRLDIAVICTILCQ